MDVVMFYVKEACECIEKMPDVSLYDCVFEATKTENLKTPDEEMGEKEGAKAQGLLQKAVEALRKIVDKIKEIAGNIRDYLKLGKDEKAAYDAFVQKCKEDKEFANKKVTVKDWKSIDKMYDSVVKEIEKEIAKVEKDKADANPNVLKSIQNKIKELGPKAKNTAIQITLDQMVHRAKYDADYALLLRRQLDNEYSLLSKLTEDLGKKEIRRNKKKLHRMTSTIRLRRWLAGVRKEQANLHEQAMIEEKDMVKTFYKSIIKSTVRNGDAGTVIKTAGRLGFDVLRQSGDDLGGGWRAKHMMKKASRQADRRYNREKRQYDSLHKEKKHDRDDVKREKNKILAGKIAGKKD